MQHPELTFRGHTAVSGAVLPMPVHPDGPRSVLLQTFAYLCKSSENICLDIVPTFKRASSFYYRVVGVLDTIEIRTLHQTLGGHTAYPVVRVVSMVLIVPFEVQGVSILMVSDLALVFFHAHGFVPMTYVSFTHCVKELLSLEFVVQHRSWGR